MRLLAPICRVFIGTDEFLVGDRYLRSVEVTLSEDARASKCSFEIYDPGLFFADKYFAMSFRDGGIQAPKDLLEDPKKNKGDLPPDYSLANGDSTGTGSTASYSALPGVASAFSGGNQSLIARAVGHSEGNRTVSGGFNGSYSGHTDPGNGAFNIGSFSYQTQQGGASTPEQADQLWLNTLQAQMPAYQAAAKAGGYDPADPRLLTNFADLYTQSPEAATGQGGFLDQIAKSGGDNSYDKILQARLASYRNPTTGKLQAGGFGNNLSRLTADQNRRMSALESVLQQSKSTQPTVNKPATPNPQPAVTRGAAQQGIAQGAQKFAADVVNNTIDSKAGQASIEDKAASKPVEVAAKGTEIIIELGYSLDAMVAYHFIHIGTEVNGRALDTTRFEGQTIRWLMTRRTKNTTYGNITLRELAEKVAKAYGFELDMEGDGPKYQHLDQTGLTDYELLLRECRAIGYSIQDDKNKLILKPWRPRFQGFVITQDVLISIRFSDRADKDRQGKLATAPNTQSQPETPAADAKTKIDKLEGSITQTRKEDSTGTGKIGVSTAGNSVLKSAQGLLKGAFGNDLDTTTKIETATGSETIKGLLQQGFSGAVTPAKQLTASITGSPSAAVTGSPAPDSAKTASTDDPVTGLPRQEIGSIDLADGTAEAQTIKDESRRVKGYESSATIITTPEALTIAPGSIIGLSRNCAPETFAREWRVGQVRHSLQPGQFRTSLEFYTPQAAKAGELAPDYSLADAGKPKDNTPVPEGKLLNPLAGVPRGTPYDPAGVIRGRPHTGVDLSSGTGKPVVAAESGKVKAANDAADGYGNCIEIVHDGAWAGWSTLYAHLASFAVSVNETVTKGQVIGVEGSTGHSDGPHLHFELRNAAGAREDPEVYFCPPPTGVYGQGSGYPIRSKC